MSKKHECYDITPKQREIAEWRHARRMILRAEYLKRVHHPVKYPILDDSAIQRYNALRIHFDKFFKPNIVNFSQAILVIASIVGLSKFLTWRKEKQEGLIRTGQISYADREFKWR